MSFTLQTVEEARFVSFFGHMSFDNFYKCLICNAITMDGSGGWNRTNCLQVMSLTSYQCSTPQYR